MKRPNRFWITSVCAIVCLLGAVRWLHTRPVHAQQQTGVYDDGTFYITAFVGVDSTYTLYVASYMLVEFDDYEDIDEIEVDGYADEDGGNIASDYSVGDDYDPAAFSLQSNAPVATGHEYGMESDGLACFDDGEGDEDCEYVGLAYASVNVASPTPQISSITPSSVSQGDQGTLTISGSNLVENSGDQLTINYSGSGMPFTLTGTPSSSTASFSYDFTGYSPGTYTLSVTNNEGTSNGVNFAVINTTIPDSCDVASNPNAGYSSIASMGTAGGSGTMAISFSGATSYATLSQTVSYGPYSTPASIAANTAALVTKNFFRYGVTAKAFGPNVVYSGNTTLGTVNTQFSGPSFTSNTAPETASAVKAACNAASVSAPIPTTIPVFQTLYLGQPIATTFPPTAKCPAGISGWEKDVVRQVYDQNGHPIQVAGQQIVENVTVGPGPNGLNLTPLMSNGQTDAKGQLFDTFKFCSPACPNSTATTNFTQVVTDTWNNVTYPVGKYVITYSCSSIKINGQLLP